MDSLKSAYDLACERIISSRQYYSYEKEKEETESRKIDFIEIPEFSDRQDVVIESDGSNNTKILENVEKRDDNMSDIKIQESESIHYNDILEVCWSGNFMDFSGFARMNRTMVFGLSNRNVRVKPEIEPYLVHINKETQAQILEMSNTTISPMAPKVFGVTVPTTVTHGGIKIVYTMIETSEKVHKDYSGKIKLMDEIWVASEYGKKILENSGVNNSLVMPLGVDIGRYKPNCGTMNLGKSIRDFKFVSVFRWSYRKGFDILLRAYLEEFSNNDNVSLLLVSRAVESTEDTSAEKIIEDFCDIKQSVDKPESDLPHVSLYVKPIGEKDMPKVYGSCNAFVLISRGEGFCLPIIEASSCGLPIIASNVTAQQDYLTNENSYLVEPDGYIEAKVGGNMSKMAKLCHFYDGQIFPNFNRKSINQTKEHMRNVFENYKEAKEKSEKLRKHIAEKYTWDMAINRVYKRLKEIS